MTHIQYDTIIKRLPALHDAMANEVPPAVQDSIFKQLNLVGKSGGGDEELLMAHAILFTLYGFRPGRQTIAESYARRHLVKAQGELREYLSAIGTLRFSIFRVLEPIHGQQDQQMRLLDELEPSNEYLVWFNFLAELGKEKSVDGLLVAGYVVSILGGHMHISTLLTASEGLLADAIGKKESLGRKGSAELIKFITRRALQEEMELRDNAEARGVHDD